MAAFALLTGASEAFTVELLGRVYLIELLLPLLALVLLATRSTRLLWTSRVFWTLVAMLLVLLAGYMISDMVRETLPQQYLRGWGRALFVLSNLVALAILVAADRRLLWWLVLGVGIGGLLYARLVLHVPLRSHFGWKFDYAPHVLLVASALAGLVPARMAALGLAALAVYGMTLEGRSYSAMALAVAGLLWMRGSASARLRVRGPSSIKLIAVGAVAAGVLMGLAAWTTNDWSAKRRAASDENRFALLAVGPRVIAGSPLIGYGSWAQHPDIAQAAAEVLGTQSPLYRDYLSSGSTLMHSQILQAWVEGGIGAGLFFAVYAVLALWALRHVALHRPRDALTGLLAYLCLNGLWHLFMSPFAATNRLDICLALGAIVLVALERRAGPVSAAATTPASAQRERRPHPLRYVPAKSARIRRARPRHSSPSSSETP